MKSKVSDFMLEKYRLGDLSPEDHHIIQEAIAEDENLRARIEDIDESDRELRSLYPAEYFSFTKIGKRRNLVWLARIAALVLVCILLPAVYFATNKTQPYNSIPVDRAKGNTQARSELSLYLKGDREKTLTEQTLLHKGNTVQLAYTVPAGERYGVIFSIDGRSAVTLHYPYREGQSSLMVSGKRTFLNEAYTLDDAPDYEVFVMVVSSEDLEAKAVLLEAKKIAKESESLSIEEKSRAIFKGCEIETVTILKE